MRASLPAAGEQHGDYLTDVCRLLWPPPARAARSAGRFRAELASDTAGVAVRHDLMVLPGWRQPRILAPAGRRASAAAIRRYGEPGSARTQIATRALAAALRAGVGSMVLRDRLRISVPAGLATIDGCLSEVLGQQVLISMHLGAARANRKPVLQLLTADGATVGFAKIGVNPLTKALVRHEHAALARLSGWTAPAVRVPAVLGLRQWQDLEVLILGPLPVWQRRRPLGPGQLAGAMASVAGAGGLRQAPLAASAYWARLAGRLAEVPDSADQAALSAAVGQLAARSGDLPLQFGASHGDWTPWNMANTASGLLVWDWERFTDDAPVGFDLLHHWLQSRAVEPGRDLVGVAADCVARSAELLAPLGVAGDAGPVTSLCYLADLSARYLADRQDETGLRLGAAGRWLIPALSAGADRL